MSNETQIPLHDYQELARNFLINTKKAGLFLDVGFGKTVTTLCALKELGEHGWINGHILIIAPKAIARSTWIDEMKKWNINVNTISLIVNEKGKQLSRKQRLELYQNIESTPPSVYFINREMICDLIEWHKLMKKKWPFPTVVIDELQSFKSPMAKRFKAMKSISSQIDRFIGLTGTPIPNGMMDLWSEIYLMDNGARLGKTLTAYRTRFFNPGLIINDQVVQWDLKKGAEKEIYNLINDITVSIKNPNLKLPTVIYNDINCQMDSSEEKLYKSLMKEQILTLTDENGNDIVVEAVNAAVLQSKLSQMASGCLYIDKELNYVKIHDKKLEQLEYIINNTGSPVLVAYYFKSDRIEIMKYLADKGISAEVLDGSPEMVHRWNKQEIPVMLLQPASFAHGLNLQDGGHTLVWYTVPQSLEAYIQTNGRLCRQGQKHTVTVHHLITKGTVDRKLLNNIVKKDTTEKALLSALSNTIHQVMANE